MSSSGPVQKSADAFRTISEVADTLKLPQHVLRFWETRFAQIKPLKRGGGRRFYRPDDVELLLAIRHLLYGEGYTIRGVQKILKEQGPRAVAALARGKGDAPLSFQDVAPGIDDGEEVAPSEDGSDAPDLQSFVEDDRPDAVASVSVQHDAPWPYDRQPAGSAEPLPWLLEQDRRGLPPERAGAAQLCDRLRGVIHEIADCRRILEAARRSD